MPIIGNSNKPTQSWHGYGGSTYPNQEAEDLALPAQRIRITKLGAWIGGWNDSPRVYLTLWDSSTGAVLAQSGQFSVADMGAPGDGKVNRYEADLVTPYETPTGGMTIRVGFTRHRDDAHQVSTGAGAGHFHGRAVYPAGAFAAIDGTTEIRRIGAYIADYRILAGAWIMRAGVWVQADSVNVYRSGAFAEVDTVGISRSASWIDAD